MKELVSLLNQASRAYYQEAQEIMSNLEYDRLYEELQELERETGTVLSDSPTIHVGYEVVSSLPKERHPSPMLSLDKTKEVSVLEDWIGDQTGLLSWKMDGLTVVLTYEGGSLVKAVTRGNGEVGEVVTNNAKVFKNVPVNIPFAGRLVLRGEAVIKYSDFEKINKQIAEIDAKYKNPRNLCSGSVRQLNNEITAKRNVQFFAFALVSAQKDGEELTFHNSRWQQFAWLMDQGFDVVLQKKVTRENMAETVEWFSRQIKENDFPSDGLVLLYDDIAYGTSLGKTAKFPRDAIAFKWADEQRETKLVEVEWSASRTGLINPVAVFEPVELEGTTVSRASVHNVSIVEELELGEGDTLLVYKANMIIPQIADNLTRSGTVTPPSVCPVCHAKTSIHNDNGVKSLYCENSQCQAKRLKSFALFASRDAMNMEGLSEATLEKFIAKGFIHELRDIYHLDQYHDEIVKMEGFGEKSYQNLMDSIRRSRDTSCAKLIYGLGIANIGLSNAKLICRHYEDDLEKIQNASVEELTMIDGIGQVIAEGISAYFSNQQNVERLGRLLGELNLIKEEYSSQQTAVTGLTFVITGDLMEYKNRAQLKDSIEKRGGKVTGSVTSKTSFLINNDAASTSSKNKKAKELGIEILTEADFIARFGK
ncbi:MAG: NAD-dependent DNA ligase LigA [Clostridiales bacterium]|nr:NAD-dependent DNA ligase LigA [Clostridiales bacterium]